MKFSVLLMSIFLPFSSVASEKDLKLIGRSLANYQVCAEIGKQSGDTKMDHYYSEMFNDTVLEVRYYPLNESEIIFKEELKSRAKLKKIDLKNMQSLCLNRFDLLSRKMQKKIKH